MKINKKNNENFTVVNTDKYLSMKEKIERFERIKYDIFCLDTSDKYYLKKVKNLLTNVK
jgi:hypothetical protein